MYKINRESNRIEKLKECSFNELGFKERENLQEWIANNPTTFGEELLIIQKEFSGFSDTHERLDLLALDKHGNLVIIENKLDDSGRDVTWQALKYASYCSSLSKEDIRSLYQDYLKKINNNEDAVDKLTDFFDGQDYEELILNNGTSQRLIMVAARFRKEVTSTVLWLMNYKLLIQCIKASPYRMEDELFIHFEQIIPTKDAEDFMIGMAEKAQDVRDSQTESAKRHVFRFEFWTKLLDVMNQKSKLFQNISPSKYNWIGTGSGVSGIGFNFAVSKSYGRAEIYIDVGDKKINELIFSELENNKNDYEKNFGKKLEWELLSDKRACRIKAEMNGNLYDNELWDEMIEFMTEKMITMDRVFRKPIKYVFDEITKE